MSEDLAPLLATLCAELRALRSEVASLRRVISGRDEEEAVHQRRGPSQRHESVVASLVAAGAQRAGFALALRRACGISLARRERLIPDAFALDEGAKRILVFEVVFANDITSDKTRRLRALHDRMAASGWSLEVRVSYAGERLVPFDLDTGRPAYDPKALRAAIDRLPGRPT